MSLSVYLRYDRKPARRFFDPPFVCPTARIKLRIAVWAEEAQVLGAIVGVVSILVIKDGFERLSVPDKGLNVKVTLQLITAVWNPLRVPPALVVTTHGGPVDWHLTVNKNVFLLQWLAS